MDIKTIKELLVDYHFIDFVLLFGSYARGTQSTLSDIDIAIHTNRSIDLLEQGEIISLLESRLEKKVDLVVLNDLYKKSAKMAYNVIASHKIILCNDRKKYIDFKTYTYKYYFDLEPMYEMFEKAMLERIDRGTYGKAQAS